MPEVDEEPWWKFRAHHWTTETIYKKILQDKFVAKMLLKGYLFAFANNKDKPFGTETHVINTRAWKNRPIVESDRTLILKIEDNMWSSTTFAYPSSYRLYHPTVRNRRHFQDSKEAKWGELVEAIYTVEENREAAIRFYETLRYIKKSKNNAKRYQKAKQE